MRDEKLKTEKNIYTYKKREGMREYKNNTEKMSSSNVKKEYAKKEEKNPIL